MIVVFGASANTGKAVAKALLDMGKQITVVGRSPGGLEELSRRGAKLAIGNLADAGFVRQTLLAADAAYVLLPYDYAAPDLLASQKAMVDSIISSAKAVGLKRLVALSSYGAHLETGGGVMSGLHYLEQQMQTLNATTTSALRAGFFFNNFLGMAPYAKGQGILGGFPIEATVSMPMVSMEDIADVAVKLLLDSKAVGHSVHGVPGPADLTLSAAAEIIGAAVGKPLKWIRFPDEDARAAMIGMGMSASVADAFVNFARAANAGKIWGGFTRAADAASPTTLETFATRGFLPAYNAA